MPADATEAPPADPSAALPGIDAHPHARAVLGPALAPHGRPAHAYLFHGPPGAGKRKAARAFAAELLSEGVADPAGARARVAHDTHPDLTWVVPTGANVMRVSDIDEAIRLANSTNYGLSASIFTRDIDRAMRFAREVDSGNLHVNWGTQWRADLMPYGGLKDSGLGKEGPKYAIREMSEEKMVVFHLNT